MPPFLYNIYTDEHNHHLQAIGRRCDVGGAWVISLSYMYNMVLLITALQTALEVCSPNAGPQDVVYNTTITIGI